MDQKELSKRILAEFDVSNYEVNKADEIIEKLEEDFNIDPIIVAIDVTHRSRVIAIGRIKGYDKLFKLIVGSFCVEFSMEEFAGLLLTVKTFTKLGQP